ncbi:NADH-quinone oxidoreductase subunit NuoG [Oscillochloris sp. ZM17-4]|uniref:NADH-quinone oxidoreductase subunit NuoG n=1 Tax=Oscillochloris sp. ZM17-4 TaxID=2866714 RepID=UPI001C73712B|nr:NADH-quinone oxidoreductase subunit NuoG [Oscillochloris sp. ZM17-4]MBX0327873.1 NADH-quinone oxidoreductase subunit NuoG [Oscillochloris sp. ZM17-4]
MPDITLTVDGVAVTVPAGTNIVDAARMVNTSIPVFCYHPRLKPAGMCRMCLVQVGTPRIDPATRQVVLDEGGRPVIAMMPKLQTGCTTPVSEGMVVKTVSDEVKSAQRGVLEFLLTSHPLDCPVCDKGGECPLQNLTMGWGPGSSRFEYNDKVHFEKPVALGDLIYLDRERCILCARCVRFQDEVADDQVLGFDNRGRNWMIISKSDPPFDSKFSGNTTDICPVGALTSSDFRFKARAWELQSKPAVCTLCPVGCNISLDMRHDKLMRVMPRENAAVNDIWICDKGRFGHRFIESGERLTTPLVRRGGRLEPASWAEATRLVAEKLAAIQSRAGGAAIGGLASPRLSNEDLYAFQKLFREQLGSGNLDHTIGAPGETAADDLGATLGVGAGTNLMQLGKGAAVLVLGADPEEEAPLYMLRLRGIAQRGGALVVAGLRPTKLERSATSRLRYRAGGELMFVRGLLKAAYEATGTTRLAVRNSGLEELRAMLNKLSVADAAAACGVSEADLRATAKTFLDADHGVIVYGSEARSAGPALAQDLAALAMLAGKAGRANSGLLALLPGGNSRGALDMGLRPDARPGYAATPSRSMGAREMWAAGAGRLRALWVAGLDPAASLPAARAAIDAAEFVVVQDMFLTATAQLADVVLPAASVAEREGSYTNAERRVQRSRQAAHPLGESRPDWQIVQGVGQALAEMAIAGVWNTKDANAKGAKGANLKDANAKGAKGAKGGSAVAVADAPGWDYLTAGELAAEIAERVPGYAGITYAALSATGSGGQWGRQVNEAIFYDGTSYENTEGVGIQCPSLAEATRAVFSLAPRPAPATVATAERPLLLLAQPLAYDGDPLLRGGKLAAHVPAAYVALSQEDAARQGIRAGDEVRLVSAVGEVRLPARVVADLPQGVVVVPANLSDADLAAVQTGPRTYVMVMM